MRLSVREVQLLPRLRALRLRAGQAGENRTVRWPCVAENESIAEWVLGGELEFVTGINQPRDEANLRQRVREVHERRCAGLVALTGPLHIDHLPDSVLAEAERLAVPLIERPCALPLIVVIEAIGSALVRSQLQGSSRQQLIEQLLDGNLTDPTALAHRSASLAIDLGRPRQVLVLRSTGTTALSRATEPDRAEALLQAFCQDVPQHLSDCLSARGQPLPVVSQAGQWIALLPSDAADAPALNRGAVERRLQRLNPGDTPLRVFAGLKLLVAIRDRSLPDRFVNTTLGPLRHHDRGHHAVLTQTPEARTQANRNRVAAAQHRLDIAIALMIWRLSPVPLHNRNHP